MTSSSTAANDRIAPGATSTLPAMVILNPSSGRGRGGRIKATIQRALAASGFAHQFIETTAQGQAIELAQQAVEEGFQTLIAVGGDGTVSEVINGIARSAPAPSTACRLGIISVGSGNDFAHTMRIAQDPVQAIQTIMRGSTRPCDLGHVVIHTATGTIERYFNNNFGIGLDPQVTLESFKIKYLRGIAMYGLAALRAIWAYSAPTVQLHWVDGAGNQGEWHAPLLLASIGNTPRSGGGFHLNPHAKIDDGLLDLVMAANMPRWQVLRLLPKAIPGNHLGDPAITSVQLSTVTISADRPLALEMDGEVITQAAEKITITVAPAHIAVIA